MRTPSYYSISLFMLAALLAAGAIHFLARKSEPPKPKPKPSMAREAGRWKDAKWMAKGGPYQPTYLAEGRAQ